MQAKAYRNSVLYVNLVSVVECSVLNCVEQKELRGLVSDDNFLWKNDRAWMDNDGLQKQF